MNIDLSSRNIYQLPFDGNIDIRPAPFHYKDRRMLYAVDFALDIGTPLRPSQNGIVRKVIDGYGQGALEMELLDKCNVVILEHEKGEHSVYAHLRKGILVSEGQEITVDQLIGYSGLSGFTGYPHLHYETMIRQNGGWLSIPTRFRISDQVEMLVSPKE